MCTADGLVVFLTVRSRAPFIPTVWLLPFQHTPSLATGSHLTCNRMEPSKELRRPDRGWNDCVLHAGPTNPARMHWARCLTLISAQPW